MSVTVFDPARLEKELKEKEYLLTCPIIFTDPEMSKQVGQDMSRINKILNKHKLINDILEFASEFWEEATYEELQLDEVKGMIDELRVSTILNGKYDNYNAILTLHAGAGGTEACDWTDILYRMYIMYCEKNGLKLEELDRLPGDGAGIKSVTFKVSGENAYGYLKGEKGIHRLVRISPFDANKRRHTSFTSMEVIPDISLDVSNNDIILRDEDLDIGTFRSSGAGGQHVNKTESAIRILHKPTGIIVKCQEERSQTQNKAKAIEKLKSLLAIRKEEEAMEEISQIKGKIKKIEWGSQIRSYVFCPYTLVKDHRTGYETSDIQRVIDGDIQGFILDYLKKINSKDEGDTI